MWKVSFRYIESSKYIQNNNMVYISLIIKIKWERKYALGSDMLTE